MPRSLRLKATDSTTFKEQATDCLCVQSKLTKLVFLTKVMKSGLYTGFFSGIVGGREQSNNVYAGFYPEVSVWGRRSVAISRSMFLGAFNFGGEGIAWFFSELANTNHVLYSRKIWRFARSTAKLKSATISYAHIYGDTVPNHQI